MFPESREVILELFHRGYRLAIVSNTTSTVEVPRTLRALEITGCFETVILSSVLGMRKPDPAMLLEATRRMGIQPERCAYIGDRLNRDVEAAQKAGFAQTVIRRYSEDFIGHQTRHPDLFADHYIDDLRELLSIFPGVPQEERVRPGFRASLSTMWARKNFPRLADFLEAAPRLGFDQVELNHQIDSKMLEGLDLPGYPISSVHEPCPADISTEELKERDWLISSPDEERRQRGVEAILHSVELAGKLGLPVIVVHCGMTSNDLEPEKKLRQLFEAGRTGTEDYRSLQQELIEARAGRIAPCLAAVKKSLAELLEQAGRFNVKLGLENRYHYFDIPSPDELAELLSLAGPERLGFVYDVGHAQALDRLGFYAHEEWLRRFSSRMIEVHLHDVQGVNDHLAPGLGGIDFDMVASYLPQEAIRTLELQPGNTPEQVKAGLSHLYRHGCIHTL
jgi:HAD superfamily hydrolase (TIGR01662 family)